MSESCDSSHTVGKVWEEKTSTSPSKNTSGDMISHISHTLEGDDFTDEEFPLEHCPDSIQSYAKAVCDVLSCPPSHVVTAMLAYLSVLIGNAWAVQMNSWVEPCVVWALLVGEPGSMKSPILREVSKPILKFQEDAYALFLNESEEFEALDREYQIKLKAYESEFKKHESKSISGDAGKFDSIPPIAPIRPTFKRLSVGNCTVEALAPIFQANPRGVIQVNDEASVLFDGMDQYKNGKGSDRAQYLEMYGAGTVEIDRKMSFPPYLRIGKAFLSILGGIQPGILRKAFNRSAIESGFSSRFLISFPPDQSVRFPDRSIPQETHDMWYRLCDTIRTEIDLNYNENGVPEPSLIQIGHKAKSVFSCVFEEIEIERRGDTNYAEKAFLSKMRGNVLRLSLILHAVERAEKGVISNDIKITENTLKQAASLTWWYYSQAQKAYKIFSSPMRSDSMPEVSNELLTKVYSHFESRHAKGQSVTARTLMSSHRASFKRTGDAECLLDALANIGVCQAVSAGRKKAYTWIYNSNL